MSCAVAPVRSFLPAERPVLRRCRICAGERLGPPPRTPAKLPASHVLAVTHSSKTMPPRVRPRAWLSASPPVLGRGGARYTRCAPSACLAAACSRGRTASHLCAQVPFTSATAPRLAPAGAMRTASWPSERAGRASVAERERCGASQEPPAGGRRRESGLCRCECTGCGGLPFVCQGGDRLWALQMCPAFVRLAGACRIDRRLALQQVASTAALTLLSCALLFPATLAEQRSSACQASSCQEGVSRGLPARSFEALLSLLWTASFNSRGCGTPPASRRALSP